MLSKLMFELDNFVLEKKCFVSLMFVLTSLMLHFLKLMENDLLTVNFSDVG